MSAGKFLAGFVVGGAVAAVKTTVRDIMLFIDPFGLGAGAGWGSVGVDHRVVWNWFAFGIAIELAILVKIGLRVVGEVLIGRILREITGPGIDCAATWINGAGDDLTDGLSANGAWGTHPKDSANLFPRHALEDSV